MVQDMGNTFWFLVHTNLFRATTAAPASAVANGVEPPVAERSGPLDGGHRRSDSGPHWRARVNDQSHHSADAPSGVLFSVARTKLALLSSNCPSKSRPNHTFH
jgi:hypothetical protein